MLYVAAGLSRIDDLKRATVLAWDEFLVDDHDTGWMAMAWETEAADRACRVGDHVLVVGCGSGRDVLMLLDRGCSVVGVDPAPGAVAAARSRFAPRGVDVPLVTGFFEDVEIREAFDVIWFSWFCYGYIPDAQRREEVLRKAASLLRPGGRIVLSVTGPSVKGRLWHIGKAVGIAAGADWELSRGDVFARLPRPGAFRYQHLFDPAEIAAEVSTANLQIVCTLQAGLVLVASPIAAREIRVEIPAAMP